MTTSYTLGQLAEMTECQLFGDENHLISGVETLDAAKASDASFLANPRYVDAMKSSHAGVICIDPSGERVDGKNYLVSESPTRAFQTLAEIFISTEKKSGFLGVHESAVIHETAQIGEGVHIGPNVTIDANVVIGNGSNIMGNSFVGTDSIIGEDCLLLPNVTLRERTILGNRVVLQPGVVIGSCGFGFTTDQNGKHQKLEQIGNVVIEDDVEIGANTTIDRARLKSTVIRQGTMIDNLVQIAHNVDVGEDSVIVAQTGIAGSTKVGKRVIIGGQSGIVGHIEIGDGVIITSRGGVSKSIKKPGIYRGEPVRPIDDYHRQQIHVRRLDTYVKQIQELKKQIHELEQNISANVT